MDETAVLLFLVLILVILLALVPSMVQTRIIVLRWMGLESMARFHEKGFPAIVLVVRAVLILLIIAMLVKAFPAA